MTTGCPLGRAAPVASPSSGLVPQQRIVVGPLVFSSDFDGGNMGRVDRLPLPPSRRVGTICEEYMITIAPDCCGTPYENGYRTWFYFGVKVADAADLASGPTPHIVNDADTAANIAASTIASKTQSSAAGPILTLANSFLPLKDCIGEDDIDRASASAEGGDDDCAAETVDSLNFFHDMVVSQQSPPVPVRSEAATEEFAHKFHKDVLEENITIQLAIGSMNNQQRLFNQGWRPWFRSLPHEPRWQQLQDTSETAFSCEWGGDLSEGGTGLTLRWKQRLLCNGGTYYFAFCTPFGYAETQSLLSALESSLAIEGALQSSDGAVVNTPRQSSGRAPQSSEGRSHPLKCLSDAIQEDWLPRVGQGIYFHRQELHRSLEHRVVELLTLTADDPNTNGSDRSDSNLDFPPSQLQMSGDPPRLFNDRPIIFFSARVHPGETPAQFSFLGVLRFLLSGDPRAAELRNQFTFKLVPILNPDGVAKGHYRTNIRGLNLNRFYDNPSREEQEGVWAAKQMLLHWADQDRLLFYVDCHGHATKRGCFFLANKFSGMGQAWNMGFARLVQINSPHFDIDGCDFAEGSAAADKGKDGFGKEGSGRVSIFRDCKLCHAYTLECNYHSGRFTKPIACAAGISFNSESPSTRHKIDTIIPYTPAVWAQIGEAICVSILDLYGHNCHSRVTSSRYGSVARLLSSCPSLRARSGCRGGSDIMPRFHAGVSIDAVSARERCCHRSSCGWKIRGRSAGKAMPNGSFTMRNSVGSIRSTSPPNTPPAKIGTGNASTLSGSAQRRSTTCTSSRTRDAPAPPRPPSQQRLREARQNQAANMDARRTPIVRNSVAPPAHAKREVVRRRSTTETLGGNRSASFGVGPRRRPLDNVATDIGDAYSRV